MRWWFDVWYLNQPWLQADRLGRPRGCGHGRGKWPSLPVARCVRMCHGVYEVPIAAVTPPSKHAKTDGVPHDGVEDRAERRSRGA